MTVKELKEKLGEFDENMTVLAYSWDMEDFIAITHVDVDSWPDDKDEDEKYVIIEPVSY